MKNFLVKSSHELYLDDYNEGEIKHISQYQMESILNTYTWQEAVNLYFKGVLYFNLDMANCDINKEYNTLETSCLVDNDNLQPTQREIELWQDGKVKLYSNNISIFVSELIPVELN